MQLFQRDTYHLATRLTVTLVLLLGPVFFSLWPFWSLNYGKELLFRFLAVMLASFFVAGSISRGSLRLELASLGKPLRLPLLLVLLSLALALVRGGALFEARATFLDVALGFLFALIVAEAFRKRTVKPLSVLFVLIFAGVVNAGMAIAQSFGWDVVFAVPIEEVGESLVAGRRKVMGFLGNPVFVSEYISATVPFVLAVLLIGRSRVKKVAMGVVLAFLVVALLVTMTRAPAISTILGFGVFLGLLTIAAGRTPHLRKEKLTVGLVFLAVVLIYVGVFAKYAGVLERYSERGSFDRRLSMWSNTKAMIEESPVLGHGLGAFKYRYLDFQVQQNLKKMQHSPPEQVRISPKGGLAHAHNEYLQMAAETGAIGLFCFAFLMVSVFRFGITSLRRALRNKNDASANDECIIVVSALTSLAIILVNGLTSFPFHIAPTATLGLTAVAFVIGPSMRLRNSSLTRQGSGSPVRIVRTPGRPARLLLTLAVFAGAIWALMSPIKALIADYHGCVGDRLRKAGSTEQAFHRYGFAAALQPDDGRLLFKMGLCLSTTGKLEDAQALYKASRLTYNVPVLLVSSSENSLRLGYVFEAIRGFSRAYAYTQMNRYNRRLGEIYLRLGQSFAESGRFDLALGCLNEARELAPSVRVLKLIAEVQGQRGTKHDAARTLTEIIEMDEFEIEAVFRLGEYYESQGDLFLARKCFERVRRLDPGFRGVGDRILSLSLELSKKEDVPAWERSKDLYLMGKLFLNYGQHHQAQEMFKRARKMGVNVPQAYYFRGESLERLGTLDEAEREYREAFLLDSHDARPLVNLLRLYDANDDEEGIEWVLQNVKNFKPEYELKKVFLMRCVSSDMPYLPGNVSRGILRGISIDELSVQWEKNVALTVVWDLQPLPGLGQCSVELLQDLGGQVLRCGGRLVLVKDTANLVRGRGAFRMTEGAPLLAGPEPKSGPSSGPEAFILNTDASVSRAVGYSERMPVDSSNGYILFYGIWASKSGAYVGKEFYDQNGRKLFFNRNRSNERECEWEYFLEYFTPPQQARFVVLFLVLEQAWADAWFDKIVLAPIPWVPDIGMRGDIRSTAQ